jgi:hypothetical protein
MDFDDAIKDHLELRRRNAPLERRLPLARYGGAVPVGSAPSLDRRPSRVLEETQEHAPAWLAASESEPDADSDWGWEDGQERR